MKIKVLLVDDHQLVREGLRLLLQREADLEVVGEAGDGPDALEYVWHCAPDLVLMDVDLGGTCGIDASRQILSERPETRILILSALPDCSIVDEAIQAGVKGYLLKSNASRELIRTIRAVMAGHFCLCPEVSNSVMTNYKQLLSGHASPPKPQLTPREIEVLKLTVEGLRVEGYRRPVGYRG